MGGMCPKTTCIHFYENHAVSGRAMDQEAGDEDDEDWGDDFGTFEEAAEAPEEQPASQAAEPVPAPPLPEAPTEDVQESEISQLFSASREELLQMVRPVEACPQPIYILRV